MKRKTVFLIVITLFALSLIAASSLKERVGERLIIPPLDGTMEFEESMPFHIAHGWRSKIGDPAVTIARGGLRLVIDGDEVPEDFIDYVRSEEVDGIWLYKYFVFNFPDGMTGTHVFDFYYSNICSAWLNPPDPYEPFVEDCENPNEILEFQTKHWVVDFIPASED